MQDGSLRALQDPLSNCRVKLIPGLHSKAQFGVISNLTAIDFDHERPGYPSIALKSAACKIEELADPVLKALTERD